MNAKTRVSPGCSRPVNDWAVGYGAGPLLQTGESFLKCNSITRPLLHPGSIFPSTALWCEFLSIFLHGLHPHLLSQVSGQASPCPFLILSMNFPWHSCNSSPVCLRPACCLLFRGFKLTQVVSCQGWTKEAGTGRGVQGLLHSLPGGQRGGQPELCVAHLLQSSLLVTWKNILAEGMPLQGQWSRHLKDVKE